MTLYHQTCLQNIITQNKINIMEAGNGTIFMTHKKNFANQPTASANQIQESLSRIKTNLHPPLPCLF